MKRRSFLKRCGSGAVLASGLQAWPAQLRAAEVAAGAPEKMARIGCTTVCFRDHFKQTNPTLEGQGKSLLEVPQLMAKGLGVHNVELWSRHFDEPTIGFAKRVRRAAANAGSKVINIQLDDPAYNLSHADKAERNKGVEFSKRWVEIAAACGASSMRANVGKGAGAFDLDATCEAFEQLVAHGQREGVKILVENHGGYSMVAKNVVAIVDRMDSAWCRSLPDFGNTPAGFSMEARLDFLKPLMDKAFLISAKGMNFDNEYQHVTYDIGACVRLAESEGFEGIYSVEMWTPKNPPADPARAAMSVIQTITENL